MPYGAEALATDTGDILLEAQERLRLAGDSESVNRSEHITDLQFGNGEQWNVDIRRDRETESRPCLTINITDAVTRRVINALRENRPRIKTHPTGGAATVQVAKVINGLIRHIENVSSADLAYDTGVESAVRGGWGYWRVGSQYVDEKSFDQDLIIQRIRNPFSVYMDPATTMPDGSDQNWCLVSDMMPRLEYKVRYKQQDPLGWQYVGRGDEVTDWSNKEQIRVAEYWRVDRQFDTLVQLSDRSTRWKDELPDNALLDAAHLSVLRERRVLRKYVEWYLLSATGILDKRDWPGKWIPIVPCYGRETDINGRIYRKGMIRDLRDPARMYNYGQTTLTEVNALQPKAPWLVADGQLAGNEAAWRDSNRKPIVALTYKPVLNPDGSVAPPPQRQFPQPAAQGLAQWVQGSQSDFMAVAGMPHEPNQDAKGEVVSGIALRKREGLADISHFDFYDNQTRSLRHTGTILLDLIPHFYDTQRIQRVIGEDGTPDTITINEKVLDPVSKAILTVRNNVTDGSYDVVVDTGPGYQTKREEAADAMLQLLATPLGQMTAQVAGDVVVRSMDFPDAETIADRMAAMIPGAQIDKNSDIPPKAQMMIKGLQQQLQQATQMITALQTEVKFKTGIEKMKQDGETQRELMRSHVKVHDTELRTATSREDTHVRATTARDVAEIQAAGTIINTHVEAAHEKELAKATAAAAEKAESKTIE